MCGRMDVAMPYCRSVKGGEFWVKPPAAVTVKPEEDRPARTHAQFGDWLGERGFERRWISCAGMSTTRRMCGDECGAAGGVVVVRWVLRLALVVVTVVTVGFNGQWSTVNGQLSTVEEEADCGAGAVLERDAVGCFAHQVWLPAILNG